MIELVVATRNLHKLRELRSILREPQVTAALHHVELDLWSLRDFPEFPESPPLEGATFQQAAEAKALHAARHLDRLVIADESGLCVPALHDAAAGLPQRRFSGPGATDKDLRQALLAAMAGLSAERRFATFECGLAFALPTGEVWSAAGSCEGEILTAERGAEGFTYDCLFLKFDYGKTFGEMGEALRNRISHRRRAFDRLLPHLQRFCLEQGVHVDH